MNIVWKVIEDDRQLTIKLEYNIFLGIKKIFVNYTEEVRLRSFKKTNSISFEYNKKTYKIELTPEDYGYNGYLVTSEGERITSEPKLVRGKTPLWIIPFVLINMSIPILAVEATTPWIIGVGMSYIAARLAKNKEWGIIKRLLSVVFSSIIAWGMYYVFYTMVKVYNPGAFIQF